jgi:hypothetical protein
MTCPHDRGNTIVRPFHKAITMTRQLRPLLWSLLAVALTLLAAPVAFAAVSGGEPMFALRWWDDVVAWVRSISWDRSRMVQLWLVFVLAGLYIILRIKPKA